MPNPTREYTNTQFRIRFRYPQSWEVVRENIAAGGWDIPVQVGIYEHDTVAAAVTVNIRTHPEVSKYRQLMASGQLKNAEVYIVGDIQDILRQMDKQNSRDLPNYKRLIAEEIQFAGAKAARTVYSYDSGGARVVEQVVTAVHDLKQHQIICEAAEKRWQEFEPQFDTILQTYAISSDNSSSTPRQLGPEKIGDLMSSGNQWKIQISIANINQYYDSIEQHLQKQSASREDFHKAITTDLRGICPQCYNWLPSATLAMPSITREMGAGSAYGEMARLFSGLCPNPNCTSKDIILIWKDDQVTHTRINACLNQIDEQRRTLLDQCLFSEARSFALDTIYAMSLTPPNRHELTGHKCSRRDSPDVFVWVSVLPGLSDDNALQQRWFPQGYLTFFDELLGKSAWANGDISLVHWTFVDRGLRSVAFLSFSINKDRLLARRSEPGSLLLPLELLTENERARFQRRGTRNEMEES